MPGGFDGTWGSVFRWHRHKLRRGSRGAGGVAGQRYEDPLGGRVGVLAMCRGRESTRHCSFVAVPTQSSFDTRAAPSSRCLLIRNRNLATRSTQPPTHFPPGTGAPPGAHRLKHPYPVNFATLNQPCPRPGKQGTPQWMCTHRPTSRSRTTTSPTSICIVCKLARRCVASGAGCGSVVLS